MNAKSLAIAAVAAWVVDSIYGFLVFGLALQSEFAKYPGVFRSFNEVNSLLPLMFGATLVGTLVVAYIFAKGHDGGSGLQEGLRFGIVFATFGLFAISIPNYVVLNYGRRIALYSAVGSFIELVLMGVVLGLIYKPIPQPKSTRQSAMA